MTGRDATGSRDFMACLCDLCVICVSSLLLDGPEEEVRVRLLDPEPLQLGAQKPTRALALRCTAPPSACGKHSQPCHWPSGRTRITLRSRLAYGSPPASDGAV